MDFENHLSLITFVVGVVFIITGVILRLFPPKSINGWYGYRTPTSMKSQQHWDFAQRYSAKKLIVGGFVLLLIAAIGLYLPALNEVLSITIGIGSMFVVSIWLIVKTEKALKKRF